MSFAYKDSAQTIIIRAPSSSEVTIPSKVTKIESASKDDYAFITAKTVLTNLIFAQGSLLREISSYSFYQCTKLTEIDLSKCTKLETIGEYAFTQCTSATTISFPIGCLTTLGKSAFDSCHSLADVTFPPTLTKVDKNCFTACKKLTSAVFPPDSIITGLEYWVFCNCPKLEKIVIPMSMTGTFHNIYDCLCVSLVNIQVDKRNPNYVSIDGFVYSKDQTKICLAPPGVTDNYTILPSVTIIDSLSFVGSGIKYVTFPPKLNRIKSWAFSTASIEICEFPKTLMYIEATAFASSHVTKVVFPKVIHTIDNKCFFECYYLKEVTLPDNYTTLGGGIFAGCNVDKFISTKESMLQVKDQNIVYSKDNKTILLFFGNSTEITIRNYVISIGSAVFYSVGIEKVIFEPESQLNSIGQQAFSGTNIKELTFPNTLTRIADNAFANCLLLKTVKFGTSFSTLCFNAFSYCSELETVTFTSRAYSIQYKAFIYCDKLRTVDFGEGIQVIEEQAFYSCTSLTEVSFPGALQSIEEYAFSKTGLTKVTFSPDSTIPELPISCFSNCNQLHTVTFPKNVEKICSSCFTGTNLTSVEISQSVSTIDSLCFKDCINLKLFTIPAGCQLQNLGFRVFEGCYLLEKIICNSNLLSVVNGALYNKEETTLLVVPPNLQLKFFSFPETLKVISQYALLHCVNIKQIFVPSNSIKEIENNAFQDCFNLVNINFPISVEKVGAEAFKNCKNLQCGLFIENQEEIYLNGLVETALLPSRCVMSCNSLFTCNVRNICHRHSTMFLNLMFIFLV